MKLTLPLLALLLTGSAQADEYGICSIGSTAFHTLSHAECAGVGGVFSPIISSCVIFDQSGNRLCPKDREIVMRAGGQYGCAKDIQPPEDLK